MSISNSTIYRISKADVGPLWRIGVRNEDDDGYENLASDWACRVQILDDSMASPRTITSQTTDNLRFKVQLTKAEVGALTAGRSYKVVVEITNSALSPAYEKESAFYIFITDDEGIS